MVDWFLPKFGDDGPGGDEVKKFYDRFEEICGLANNGQGMSDKEMIVKMAVKAKLFIN